MVEIQDLVIGKKYKSTDSKGLVTLVSIDLIEDGKAVLTVKEHGKYYFGFNFRLSEAEIEY